MAVVINDFEVIAEDAPPAAAATDTATGAHAPSAAPTPQELELVNRRQHERAQRVHAD
ncbi:MAG: hypothetical protein ACJ74Q_01660 [Pyrinomonadaceae bacterium]